jgi:NitT/TauT family transport system permease protein
MSAQTATSGAAVSAPPPGSDEISLATRARALARRRLWIVRATQAAVLVVLLGAWEILSRLGVIDPFFFGSPLGVALQIVDWARNGTGEPGPLWQQIAVTMEEALFGFFFGVVTGIVLGVALGVVPFLADVFQPYIKAINALPRIVLGSIFVVWLGFGLASKVVLAAVLVFFVVFFNAFQGVRSVDRNFVANARILGASPLQVVTHVVIPSATTWIIASLHVALGLAIIGAIVGEYLGAQHGLGLVISFAQNNFNPDGVFAAMLIIGVLATVAEWAMGLVEKRLLAWRPPLASEGSVKGI